MAGPSPIYGPSKRVIDFLVAAVVLIVGSPVWLLLSLIIRITTGSPVIYRSLVAGKDGKPFAYFKFRTMHTLGSSQEKSAAAAFERSASVAGRKDVVDAWRITPVGRLLRKTGADEFPQFWNVLCGQMSLVGPRPPLFTEYQDYPEQAKARLAVKPGITGLYQVSVRGNVDFVKMFEIDVDYIARRSLALDFSIMFRTAMLMLRARGSG